MKQNEGVAGVRGGGPLWRCMGHGMAMAAEWEKEEGKGSESCAVSCGALLMYLCERSRNGFALSQSWSKVLIAAEGWLGVALSAK